MTASARTTTPGDTLTLGTSSSIAIPQLGLGTHLSPPDRTTASCLAALDAGYRLIDTAQYYGNEAEVGRAIRQCGLPRGHVFVTTKILKTGKSVEDNYASCLGSIRRIAGGGEDEDDDGGGGGGYVDLFLIHSPRGKTRRRREMWLALERLYGEGKARAIGVSNFGIGHLEELRGVGSVWPPHVNQIEARFQITVLCPASARGRACCAAWSGARDGAQVLVCHSANAHGPSQLHPWCQQKDIVAYCRAHGIVLQAYCPLVRNQKAQDGTTARLATKHAVTPSQVLVRWSLQKGFVCLPKSDDAGRIRLNADVRGFELDADDMAALDALDQGPAGALVFAVQNA